VDAYAQKVSRVLAAVDARGKGNLTEAEANRIMDPALRSRVLDVRTALMSGGDTGTVTDPSTPAGTRPTTARVLLDVGGAVNALAAFWDSGDNGVNVTVGKLAGSRTMAQALQAVTQDAATPWTHAEASFTVGDPRGAEAINAFCSDAQSTLEDWNPDAHADVQAFVDAAKATFGRLSDVRIASGQDLGGSYLVGKTKDGFVALVCQKYTDA
jgi:hypothetical protein